MKGRAFALCALLAAGLGACAAAARQEPCKPDNETRVAAGGECLAIRTFRPARPGPTLVVFLHGDLSKGGGADYIYAHAQNNLADGMVAVALLRPGYFDREGNRSTGDDHNRRDGYTPHNVDAVAAAVKALRAHHRAARVLLAGHSGGAATAGVILGRHPGLADGALLAACPCDIPGWRAMLSGDWPNSLSPHAFADWVPRAARVIAVTGSRDGHTSPSLAEQYVNRLARRGVKARFVLAEGADHAYILQAPEAAAALRELLAD
jgi:pimeloyl-ACP methyl ester carboxylesterase